MKKLLTIITLSLLPFFAFAQNTNDNQSATQASVASSSVENAQSVSQNTAAKTTSSDAEDANSENEMPILLLIIMVVLLYPLWKISKILTPILRIISAHADGETVFPEFLVASGAFIMRVVIVLSFDAVISFNIYSAISRL